MQTQKLTDALAALKKVTKGDGVVSMDAEQLATYAEEQIAKSATDADAGASRMSALTDVVVSAADVFKASVTAKYDFVPFTEPAQPDPLTGIAKQLEALTALLAKQEPTSTIVHPPQIPDGHDGGSIATNNPQGDDNGPRPETTKGTDAAPPKPDGEVAKADVDGDASDAPFSWPVDMAKGVETKKLAKRAPVDRDWGADS